MRALMLALLAACSHETSVHDLIDCESGSGDCEYGCRRGYNPPTDAGTCVFNDPAVDPPPHICPETFFTDGADPNHHGCCVRDDGVLRFRECCTVVSTDAGPGMNQPGFDCPE